MVVSDTSPILNLALIGQLDLLRRIYGELLIPDAVRAELRALATRYVELSPDPPPWVSTRRVGNPRQVEALVLHLDSGESEAIALALETAPEFLLIDEHRGRKLATRLGVRCIGVLGTLAEAKRQGLVPAVRPLLDALILRAGFWMSAELRDRVLRQVREAS